MGSTSVGAGAAAAGPGEAAHGAAPQGEQRVLARRLPAPPTDPSGPVTPRWLRAASDWTWRSVVIALGVIALVYALGYLRVVVLPVIVALLVTTLLLPATRAMRNRGVPDGLAAAGSMV